MTLEALSLKHTEHDFFLEAFPAHPNKMLPGALSRSVPLVGFKGFGSVELCRALGFKPHL